MTALALSTAALVLALALLAVRAGDRRDLAAYRRLTEQTAQDTEHASTQARAAQQQTTAVHQTLQGLARDVGSVRRALGQLQQRTPRTPPPRRR